MENLNMWGTLFTVVITGVGVAVTVMVAAVGYFTYQRLESIQKEAEEDLTETREGLNEIKNKADKYLQEIKEAHKEAKNRLAEMSQGNTRRTDKEQSR